MTESIVQIPGIVTARVERGRVTGYTFTPRAADAGYFGEAIYTIDGPKIDQDEFFGMVNRTLMISNDNKSATFSCEWTE
jgi:hypothetical protein